MSNQPTKASNGTKKGIISRGSCLAFLGIIFFIIIVIVFTQAGAERTRRDQQTKPINSNQSTQTPTQEVKEKQYVEVFNFSGTGIKDSEPFKIMGNRFKVKYDCKGSLCQAWAEKVGAKSGSEIIMNTTSPINDETIIYGGGEWHIRSNVIGNWSMVVYDYK